MNTISLSELSPLISDGIDDAHKFLILPDDTVIVSTEPFNPDVPESHFNTLSHQDWLSTLKREGRVSQDIDEHQVSGGYLKKLGSKLRFWGESTTPIKGATENRLFKALEKNGAVLVSVRRRE